jgi:hypothetical protein
MDICAAPGGARFLISEVADPIATPSEIVFFSSLLDGLGTDRRDAIRNALRSE